MLTLWLSQSISTNIYMCVYMCVCVCLYVYIHIYTYMYMHIYTGERNSNPFQCSCLEISMDRGPWQAKVHGVGNIRPGLSTWAHMYTYINICIIYSIYGIDNVNLKKLVHHSNTVILIDHKYSNCNSVKCSTNKYWFDRLIWISNFCYRTYWFHYQFSCL